MKNNQNKPGNKKEGKTNSGTFETGIPDTDVLGMQNTNQATADKIHSSRPIISKESKNGKNNLKNTSLLVGLIITSMLFSACNSNGTIEKTEAATVESIESANGKVNADDARFAIEAASGGMLEVELGKLCPMQANNFHVKTFGAMMVDDHTQANNELKSIAANKNLTLPVTMNNKDQKMYDDLKKKTGSDFDNAYIQMMVSDHEKDLSDFKKESAEGKDADISSFATKTLPVLQKHMEAAKAAQQAIMGKS